MPVSLNGTSGLTFDDGTSQATAGYPSFRNKLINGAFDFWQRGTSFASGGGVYTADRWAGNNATGAVSQQTFALGQTDVPGNPEFFLRFVSTAALDGIRQRVEGVHTLAGGTATLSFYAKVGTGTLVVTPKYTQVFGTGGTPSANVSLDGSAKTLTTTWQRFTDTVTLGSLSGKTLGTNGDDYLQVSLSCGAAGTVDVALVQLEAGSSATPFEVRPFGTELALCQRYYEVGPSAIKVYAQTTSAFKFVDKFTVPKRANPTMTYTTTNVVNQLPSATFASGSNGALGTITYTTYRANTTTLMVDATNTGTVGVTAGDAFIFTAFSAPLWTASAEL